MKTIEEIDAKIKQLEAEQYELEMNGYGAIGDGVSAGILGRVSDQIEILKWVKK
jgi:hypothetical protein